VAQHGAAAFGFVRESDREAVGLGKATAKFAVNVVESRA
jgi:hypothetical protein